MKNKLLFLFIALAFVLNLSVYAAAQEATGKEYEQATINKGRELAKLLPDSDVVITLKLGEILRKTLPQFLSANHQPLLTKFTDDLDKIKVDNRGFDLRDVENVAIGLKFNPDAKNNPDFPEFSWSLLFQSRSKIDSKLPILMAKRIGKYHQEKIGKHTIYITQELNEKKSSDKNKPNKSKIKKYLYCAVASYSNDIIAMGSMEHVKKTIGESQKVSATILDLLNRKPAAILTFGSYFPKGFSPYIDFEDSGYLDGLNAAIGSIRQVQGSLDTNEGNAFISVVVETSDTKNARFLHDLLVTGRLFLTTRLNKLMKANAHDSEWNHLKEMIENSKVSRDGEKVMLSLKVTENAFGFLLNMIIEDIVYSKEKVKGSC